MEHSEILRIANEIVAPHGLRAEFLGDPENVKSVGVGGDFRTYTPVIVLVGPQHPGGEILAQVATEISNRTFVNRVTFQLWPVPKRSEPGQLGVSPP